MKKLTFCLLSGLLFSVAAAQAPDLTGNWKVVGWTLPGAVPIRGHLPTLTFRGGTVSGTAGCNRYSGGYRLSGDQIGFAALGLTRMACPDPVNQQEQTFIQALSGQTLKVARNADSLTLTTREGAMLNIRPMTLQANN